MKEPKMFDGVFLVWVIAASYGIVMGSLDPDWWWYFIGGAICFLVCRWVYNQVEK